MSIIALYVYSPTMFQTDMKIESMFGTPVDAGEVDLQPGIYRVEANANLVSMTGVQGSGYTRVTLGGTKGGWPDPPLQAIQQNHTTKEEVMAFLGGEGDENELA